MRIKKNKHSSGNASDVLEGVVSNGNGDLISFQEIKLALHERGFGILLIMFALPLSIPLPVPPGLTAIPGIPLLFFSVQLLFGRDVPWLPKWIEKKTIKRSTLAFMIEKASPYLRKVERLLRPRIFFAGSTTGEKIVGFFCFMFSISILIPLPLTNFIPAIGIVLMALGLMSCDGVPIILGMIIGSIGITITTLVIFFGKKAVMELMSGFASVIN